MAYIYGVEKWDDRCKEWISQRFDCHDLDEVGEVINILEEALPNREFRPAQYTVEEYHYIKSFE